MREQLVRDLFGTTQEERAGQTADDDDNSSNSTRDMRFKEMLQHFLRMPEMLVDIEFYFAVTMLSLTENILSLLLLPLKCLVAFSRFERRDAVALVLIIFGILTYGSLSLYTTQLYAYLYHVVRRTSFIKLVMVFNILEVADRLLSALSQEAIEVLTVCVQGWGRGSTAYYKKSSVMVQRSLWLPFGSALVSAVCVAAHAVTLLLSVVTLNVAVNAEGHLLLALMISNNFSEVKGVAYKKHNRESLLQVAAADAIERLKFFLFVLVMVIQHMHERFDVLDIADTLLILIAEVFIDYVKHLFVAKFNGISLGVYRCYSQLALVDMASETVLWRLEGIQVQCVDDPLTDTDDVRGLLSPSAGFFPKYVKRTGFIPVPYVALLLWSIYPFASLLLARAPLLFVLTIAAIVFLKVLVSEFIRGIASRFVVRSLIAVNPRKHRTNSGGTNAVSDLPFGVSPLGTPSLTPQEPPPLNVGSESVVTLQLSSFLCSLLKLDPFDLQAGKSKK
ncbi:Tapt1 family [Trypanosoma melophagium]|uniref:Tapt1 family n=1 Tax=Trypanosoma melophagium TaxID=715481 RepID=UPI003519E8E4|nr:Tapt1 family [Trypanosoma melophagium]